MLSSKMMTGASALRLCSHVPVFDVPKTLARVGQRSDAQSLHEPALRIEVVAVIQEHDRNLFRDRLEHRRVELTAPRPPPRPTRARAARAPPPGSPRTSQGGCAWCAV